MAESVLIRNRSVLRTAAIGCVALLAIASIAVGAAALSGPGAKGPAASRNASTGCHAASGGASITVHGTGIASGPPDLLTIIMSVNTTAPSASAALAENDSKASLLITSLGHDGVPSRDVQTTGLSIQPQYDYNNSPATISGFNVTHTLTIRLRNLSTAGAVIGTAAASIGNSISLESMGFSLSNQNAIASTARQSAVRQAISYARAMASASGRKLGAMCSATDVTPPATNSRQPTFQALNDAAGRAAATAVPLQGGTERVTATVTMTFATRVA